MKQILKTLVNFNKLSFLSCVGSTFLLVKTLCIQQILGIERFGLLSYVIATASLFIIVFNIKVNDLFNYFTVNYTEKSDRHWLTVFYLLNCLISALGLSILIIIVKLASLKNELLLILASLDLILENSSAIYVSYIFRKKKTKYYFVQYVVYPLVLSAFPLVVLSIYKNVEVLLLSNVFIRFIKNIYVITALDWNTIKLKHFLEVLNLKQLKLCLNIIITSKIEHVGKQLHGSVLIFIAGLYLSNEIAGMLKLGSLASNFLSVIKTPIHLRYIADFKAASQTSNRKVLYILYFVGVSAFALLFVNIFTKYYVSNQQYNKIALHINFFIIVSLISSLSGIFSSMYMYKSQRRLIVRATLYSILVSVFVFTIFVLILQNLNEYIIYAMTFSYLISKFSIFVIYERRERN